MGRYYLRPVPTGFPVFDLVRFAAFLECEGMDARLAALSMILVEKKSLQECFLFMSDTDNRSEWRGLVSGLRARAARDEAKFNETMREHYGGPKVVPFKRPNVPLRIILPGDPDFPGSAA